jgi:hypothetical protein
VALWAVEGFRVSLHVGDEINPIDRLQGAECDEKGEDYRSLIAVVQPPTGGRACSQKFLKRHLLGQAFEQEPRQKKKKKEDPHSYHHPDTTSFPFPK